MSQGTWDAVLKQAGVVRTATRRLSRAVDAFEQARTHQIGRHTFQTPGHYQVKELDLITKRKQQLEVASLKYDELLAIHRKETEHVDDTPE